jgi:hypothetical protein
LRYRGASHAPVDGLESLRSSPSGLLVVASHVVVSSRGSTHRRFAYAKRDVAVYSRDVDECATRPLASSSMGLRYVPSGVHPVPLAWCRSCVAGRHLRCAFAYASYRRAQRSVTVARLRVLRVVIVAVVGTDAACCSTASSGTSVLAVRVTWPRWLRPRCYLGLRSPLYWRRRGTLRHVSTTSRRAVVSGESGRVRLRGESR